MLKLRDFSVRSGILIIIYSVFGCMGLLALAPSGEWNRSVPFILEPCLLMLGIWCVCVCVRVRTGFNCPLGLHVNPSCGFNQSLAATFLVELYGLCDSPITYSVWDATLTEQALKGSVPTHV